MKAGSAVRVTTTSSLAAMVLIPSQHEFEQANPDIALEVSTGESLDSQPYSIPIRLGDIAAVQGSDVISYETFNVFGAYGMKPPSWLNEPSTLFTTQWKNKSLPPPPLDAWLDKNGLNGADVKLRNLIKSFSGFNRHWPKMA